LPEDTYEAFLSAPIVSRRGVLGVINVQHRNAHSHSGGEMELLTTVGEQLGCLFELSRRDEFPVRPGDGAAMELAPAGSGLGRE